LGGLPGTGKSRLARGIAHRWHAMHVRIDTIEQALANVDISGPDVASAGYVVAYAVAEDNLRLGQMVIADSVNPVEITRAAWLATASRAGAFIVNVEVLCSDREEHRHRVESRVADIAGHVLPTWRDVLDRHYEPREDERIVIDTAHLTESACVDLLDQRLHAVMEARTTFQV
jgi:predicted kinase